MAQSSTIAVLSCSQPKRLAALVARLGEQSVSPDEILVIWNSPYPIGCPLTSSFPIRVITIPASQFGHGRTRNLALSECSSDILVLLSDDAWPADDNWLCRLLSPFEEQPDVAAVFGRQIADDSASPEACFRRARYPTTSDRIQLLPGRVLHLLRTPASNASAAYKASALRLVGGFADDLISSEDIAAAIALLDAGHAVWYAADSLVVHSHRYGFWRQLRRTCDMAMSQRQICRRFNLRMSKTGYRQLLSSLQKECGGAPPRTLLAVPLDLAARALGVALASVGPFLPIWLLRRISTQRWYFAERRAGGRIKT